MLGIVPHLILPDVTGRLIGYLHLVGILGHYAAGRVQGWVSLPFGMILDALSYDVFGSTPGKWIGGIRALDLRGVHVPFRAHLRRNFGVYWYGLGTDFPIVALFTLIAKVLRRRSTCGTRRLLMPRAATFASCALLPGLMVTRSGKLQSHQVPAKRD